MSCKLLNGCGWDKNKKQCCEDCRKKGTACAKACDNECEREVEKKCI